jgi:hypothetical protein
MARPHVRSNRNMSRSSKVENADGRTDGRTDSQNMQLSVLRIAK